MAELAGDECIIRKRAASCILPRKRSRDGNRPFLPDLVIYEIQLGQGGAEKSVKKRTEEGKWEELAGDKRVIRKRTTRCILPRKRPRDSLCALNANLVVGQIKRFQWGTEKPNRNRDALVSRLLGIGWRCGLEHSKARGELRLTWEAPPR